MPKMDTGIRTQQGADLFSRVNHGQTGIHFTKAVFSSVDLTGKSTDDIRQMTDIEPQELVVDQSSTRLQTLDEPVTDQQQNPETVVRAIAVNDPLTADSSGFYVRTFGLYATDDQGNTVLYGVSLDSHPAYMPQFQGQEQRLAFDWDEDTSDKANIQFTNVHTAYVTWWDFQQFSQAIKSGVDSTEATLSNDNASLASSVNSDMSSGSSALSSHSVSMTSFANSMATSLTNSVNGLPHWDDENYTRNVIAPSLATSAANSAGASAISQANVNMDYNKNSLNGRVNALPTWDDMNWTRGQAQNYAESAKTAAQNHADTGDYNLQNQITNNNNSHTNTESGIQNRIASDETRLGYNGDLPANADFDTYQFKTGFYRFTGANFTHAPAEVNGGWGLLQVAWWDENTHTFVITDLTHHVVYVGDVGGGSQVQWRKIATVNDVSGLWSALDALPTWNDMNYTRNTVAPNAANSAKADANVHADAKAQSAIDQANANMGVNRQALQNQITSNWNRAVMNIPTQNIETPTHDLNKLTTAGYFQFNGAANVKNMPSGNHVNSEWFMVHVLNISAGIMQVFYSFMNGDIFVRGSNDQPSYNRWNDWVELAGNNRMDYLQSQINSASSRIDNNASRLLYHGELNENFDFNSGMLERGFYFFRSCNFTNSPCADGDWGWVAVNWYDAGTSSIILHDLTKRCIYTRVTSGGGHDPWIRVATEDDINGAISKANTAATNAMNQAISTANGNMENNRVNLQNQINANKFNSWYAPNNSTNDLNTLTTPGYYDFQGVNAADGSRVIKNMPSFPSVNSGWFDIHVMTNSAGIYQVFYSFMSNDIYMRCSNTGGQQWTNWSEVGQDHIQAAANETDAQNKSGQHPGTLFVYSD